MRSPLQWRIPPSSATANDVTSVPLPEKEASGPQLQYKTPTLLKSSVFKPMLSPDYDQLNTEDPHPVFSSIVPAPLLSNTISSSPSTSVDVVAAVALQSLCRKRRIFYLYYSGNKTLNEKRLCKSSWDLKFSRKQTSWMHVLGRHSHRILTLNKAQSVPRVAQILTV